MGRIIVTEFVTLDGVVEAPGGVETDHPHRGWQPQYRSAAAGQYKIEELAAVEALLLGRKTYDLFSRHWPGVTSDPFAERMNSIPKYVASHSLQRAEWNNSHLIRDVASELPKLTQSLSGDMLVYGSATLVKGLIDHDLVDELRLMIYPVTIGGGQRLFAENLQMKKFNLRAARSLEGGILLVEYVPIERRSKS